jgi:hypothetical protein
MAEYLNSTKTFFKEKGANLVEGVKGGNPIALVATLVLSLVLLYFLYTTGLQALRNLNYYRRGSPFIIKDTKDAKRQKLVEQNPNKEGGINLPRSENETGGIEFSYSCWMLIDDYSYKLGQWKHVFHKGSASGSPLRAPGVWLHPDKNAMRIYMNTFKEIYEYIDIENIPINKWFSLVLVLKGQTLDVYINGNIKKSLKLTGLPKQNYGNLYVNSFGGYSGMISKLRYYDYSLKYSDIDAIQKTGPSLKVEVTTVKDGERPPYLSQNWWTND